MALEKDAALDRLAALGNVAQFVAFRPAGDGQLRQSFSRIRGLAANEVLGSPEVAFAAMLKVSGTGAVNIRSYLPDDPRSREFVYGLRSAAEVAANVSRLAAEGLHLIVNETIDVNDGGVSGVSHGDVVEFAPDDTPRAVERPGTAALPRDLGLSLLTQVYGSGVRIPGARSDRVEFSVHPGPRGLRGTNTILWEIETGAAATATVRARWPNRFSRHVGDKAFGLLVAAGHGAAVPRTLVIPRRVAPFSFGEATGTGDTWIRTCPREPTPGLYTTAKGWRDPFALLAAEDPDEEIASVLAQDGIRAEWSGAAIVDADGRLVVEGVAGEGDAFMLGMYRPASPPPAVGDAVAAAHRDLAQALGPIKIEWVHDGRRAWVVQLHVGQTDSAGTVIVPGEPTEWMSFDIGAGLPGLRDLLARLEPGAGVQVEGEVGLTSHVADVLRKVGRPARMAGPRS